MKVTAFVGSARKKHTYNAVLRLMQDLQSRGDIAYEIVSLSDYHLEVCKGCKLCTDRGDELCPLKDDRDILIEKMNNSDGVVFASPNYSFNLSGLMKCFLDRLGFIFHRPRYFGKTFTSIVVQGIYGGGKIVGYFNFIGSALGFNVVKGICLNTLDPVTEKQRDKNNKHIDKLGKKFYAMLIQRKLPVPSLFELMIFRMSRKRIRTILDENYRDYNYYKDHGWFESDFYYPVHLNPIKKMVGRLFDLLN